MNGENCHEYPTFSTKNILGIDFLVFEFEIHLDSFMTSCQQNQFNLRPHLKAQGQVLNSLTFQIKCLPVMHVIWTL